MAFYSIGEVAERCGINPVTLRAWQRRYGLLKPQRSEGGHRQFDEEDILRIEEIKRWIERGVSVGKVKALLEDNLPAARDESAHLQEEMMSILRYMQPARIRAKLMALSHQHPIDTLIDSLLVPVRQRLKLDQNTSLVISSMLDGLLIDCVALFLAEPLESPRPELFPGQHIFVWTGRAATPLQEELLSHWQEQGFSIHFHGQN
ncbi:MerR family transcriptional regulator [Klebsiella pneumoniae]